ncbi:GFA family protein [bacterium]|nr:GFA family protein [bacterium]
MNKSIKGKCFCESVTFSFALPILFCVHCHCNYCRHAQGSAFVTWVGVDEAKFSYKTGENLVTWYKSTEESGRGFCSRCGSTMFYKSSLAPGEIHIARPYIDSSLELKPNAHVFYDQHVNWIAIHDDLQKLDSDNKDLSTYSVIPKKNLF